MAKPPRWLRDLVQADVTQNPLGRRREDMARLPQRTIGAADSDRLRPRLSPESQTRKELETVLGLIPGGASGMELAKGHLLAAGVFGALDVLPGGKFASKALGKRFAVLTAENAGGTIMKAASNRARMSSLLKEIESRGYKPVPVTGRYKDPTTGVVLQENSFLVPNMPEREAKLLGRRFGQDGILTQAGYHDMVAGKLFPATGVRGAKDVPYTQFPGGKKFALDIDWDNPVTSGVQKLPVPKGANPEVQRIAQEYGRATGKVGRELPPVKAVDPERGRLMAKAYEKLQSTPNDPQVRASYGSMVREARAQLEAIKDAGYKIEYVDRDPYKSSADMMRDLSENRTLKVLKTSKESAHPLMSAPDNDVFRAVHDFFGHAQRGYQFGPKGEEGAFRSHSAMFSPEARAAMATETRGQNSFVNFGPGADLPPGQRPFAPQKAALFPRELLGDYADMILGPAPASEASSITGVAVRTPRGVLGESDQFGKVPAYGKPGQTVHDLDETSKLIVSRDEAGKPVGYLHVGKSLDREGYDVFDVLVDPSQRRKGVAKSLYHEAQTAGLKPRSGMMSLS